MAIGLSWLAQDDVNHIAKTNCGFGHCTNAVMFSAQAKYLFFRRPIVGDFQRVEAPTIRWNHHRSDRLGSLLLERSLQLHWPPIPMMILILRSCRPEPHPELFRL